MSTIDRLSVDPKDTLRLCDGGRLRLGKPEEASLFRGQGSRFSTSMLVC